MSSPIIVYRRIDNQGCCQDRLFRTKEAMRLQLIDWHSVDWSDEKIDIFTLSLEDILDIGDWSIEEVNMDALTLEECEDIEG